MYNIFNEVTFIMELILIQLTKEEFKSKIFKPLFT